MVNDSRLAVSNCYAEIGVREDGFGLGFYGLYSAYSAVAKPRMPDSRKRSRIGL